MWERILKFLFGSSEPRVITDKEAEISLFEKYGYYHNTTERCPDCNKLYYRGILPADAEQPCRCPNQPKYQKPNNNNHGTLKSTKENTRTTK